MGQLLCALCLGKQGLADIPEASSESPVTWALRSHLSVLKPGARRRGLIEIKASGEENGVTAKGKLCHPELTDLLGISCRCVWSRGRGRAAGRTASRSG